MKKLVSIILMVVLMMTVVSAIADTHDGIFYGIDYSDAEEIMKEYATLREYNNHLNENGIDGVLYSLGGVCIEDFKSQSGQDWSIDAFNSWSEKDFEIVEIHTEVIEVIDGIIMYRAQAQSENVPLGYKNGEAYYCADVVFMVFSLYDYD